MRLRYRFSIIFVLLVVLLAACGGKPEAVDETQAPTRAPIQSTQNVFTASLSEIAGGVLARTAQETAFSEARDGYVVQVLGQVQTQTDGRSRLDFSSGSLIRLGPNTLFTLQPPQENSQGLLIRVRLEVGRLWVILQGGSLEVETKSGVAAVRGSYMSVEYDPDSGEARITCLEGNCSLTTSAGSVQITAGQTAIVTGANQPPQVGKMDDQDVQEWLNNNPEAAVVVPAQTEAPVATEIPGVTKIPPTAIVVLPPPAVVNPPVPTKKVSPPKEPVDESTATQTLQPAATPTGTTTTTLTSPVLNNSVVVISGVNVSGLPADGYPEVVGEPVDVFITVSGGGPTPTGTVWIQSGVTTLCTVVLEVTGNATCSFTISTPNDISLEADYSGDSQYSGSNSTLSLLAVDQATTTTTFTGQVPNPSNVGGAVTFTANVDVVSPGAGMPTGSVTFSDTYGDSCIAASAPWTCPITFSNISVAGSYTVIATYSGDTNFLGSSSTVTQIINP